MRENNKMFHKKNRFSPASLNPGHLLVVKKQGHWNPNYPLFFIYFFLIYYNSNVQYANGFFNIYCTLILTLLFESECSISTWFSIIVFSNFNIIAALQTLTTNTNLQKMHPKTMMHSIPFRIKTTNGSLSELSSEEYW